MNDSESWAQGFRCYEKLGIKMTWMTPGPWSQGSRFYEKFKAIDDMKDFGCGHRALNAMNSLGLFMTWMTLGRVLRAPDAMKTQGYGCFKQLSIMNYMNDLISHELRPLYAMSSLGLWMIWMILHHEQRVVDDMNDFELWAHDSRFSK